MKNGQEMQYCYTGYTDDGVAIVSGEIGPVNFTFDSFTKIKEELKIIGIKKGGTISIFDPEKCKVLQNDKNGNAISILG